MTTLLVQSIMRGSVQRGAIPLPGTAWFDISPMTTQNMVADLDLLLDYQPPFENCMVCFKAPAPSGGLFEGMLTVAGESPEDGIAIAFVRTKDPSGAPPAVWPWLIYSVEDGALKFGSADEDAPIRKDQAEFLLGLVSVWYSGLAQGCQAYQPFVRTTFTNRRKIAKNKPPIYDWRTVVIKPTPPRIKQQGGTHASPRQHDRRGHLRRLSSGKNVWVRACKVGDSSLGIVFKDYEVRGQITALDATK